MKLASNILILLTAILSPPLCVADDGGDLLAKLAAEKRAAAIRLATSDATGESIGFGAFLSEDGLALVDLGILTTEQKPKVTAADGTPLGFGKILGVFPGQLLVLMKFEKYRPRVWLPITPAEPEIGDKLALVTLNKDEPLDHRVPPIIETATAKRLTMVPNLREQRLTKMLSLGADPTQQQLGAIGAGVFAVDSKGNLVGFSLGVGVEAGQTNQQLTSAWAMAEEIRGLEKAGVSIPFPLPDAHNPYDKALFDNSYTSLDMASRRGDKGLAMHYFRDLLKRHPTSRFLKFKAATAFLDPANPLVGLDDFPDLGPGASVAEQIAQRKARSHIYAYRFGDVDGAIRELEKAAELCPEDFPDIRLELGMYYLYQVRLDEAERVWRAALPWAGDSIEFINGYRSLLAQLGKVEEAEKLRKRAVELVGIYRQNHPIARRMQPDSGFAEKHFHLAKGLAIEGRFGEAQAASRRIVKLFPNHQGANALLAIGLLVDGRFEEARVASERGKLTSNIIPSLKEVESHLIKLLREEGADTPSAPGLVHAMSKVIPFDMIPLPDPKLRRYWEAHKAEVAAASGTATLRVITIRKSPADPGRSPEVQAALAKEIHAKLASGADFAELARAHSVTWAKTGGLMGEIRRGALSESLDKVAFTLAVDGISEVIEDPIFYTILKVEGRRPGKHDSFEDPGVKEAVEALVKEKRREKWEKEYLARLVKKVKGG